MSYSFNETNPPTYRDFISFEISKSNKIYKIRYPLGKAYGDSSSSANGDPHFKQTVYDLNTDKLRSICYDVTGEPGQKINIINFKRQNLSIFGQLLDDYYMHKIELKYTNTFLLIGVNVINFGDVFYLNWNEIEEKGALQYKKFFVKSKTKNSFIINFLNIKEDLIIERKVNNFNDQHLDVYIQNFNVDYKYLGGLIGYLGSKEYRFYEEVQENARDLHVHVDNELRKGRRVRRENNDCILFEFQGLIEPMKKSVFVF